MGGKNKRSLQYHQKKHRGETFSCEHSSSRIAKLQRHCKLRHEALGVKCENPTIKEGITKKITYHPQAIKDETIFKTAEIKQERSVDTIDTQVEKMFVSL